MEILTKDNFYENIKEELVFVDFFAQWCGPCKIMTPIFESLAKNYEHKVKFYKVDIDVSESVALEFTVMSVPTFILFKNGIEIEREVGAVSKDRICEMIDSNI